MVDPASVLVVVDTNSAARPADKGTPRLDDMGSRALPRAFNPRDLVDKHPIQDLPASPGDRLLPH